MIKRMIYLLLIFSLIFQLGCRKKDYKRIIVEEDVGLESEKETIIEHFIPGQVYLELDRKDYFYPLYYNNSEVYGDIKKVYGKDTLHRKYLYQVDTNNKLTETVKVNINYIPGYNSIGLIEYNVYTDNYSRRNNLWITSKISKEINLLKENNKESQYIVSYVSGSKKHLTIVEVSTSGNLNNIYLYDISREELYTNEKGNIHGDFCYVEDLQSLIWIDQKDYKIYKVSLKDGYYVLEEYIDLEVDEDIDRVRGIMKNSYELILFQDSRLNNKDEWDLMETSLITCLNLRNYQYEYLFKKPTDENLYIEYLGQDIFIEENFNVFEDYIEIIKRKLYYHDHNGLSLIYNEEYQEKSQQPYPDIKVVINSNGNEIFSTREIRKIIDDIPITERIIYQRIKLTLSNIGK